MGHVRNYTMGDVVARYKRAKGFNVLHPMGWDAFGMPAENAAMADKVHPKNGPTTTSPPCGRSSSRWGCRSTGRARSRPAIRATTSTSRRCSSISWRAGLVERKQSKVNWDPVDQTVLANEQVIDGRGWRSGALVEQRELTQWFFKITDYAQDLLDAHRPARALAREGAADAAELDRPLGGAAGPLRARSRHHAERRERARDLHDPARHVVRREIHGDLARPSAGRRGGGEESGARRIHRRMPPQGTARSSSRPPRRRASTPA